MIDSCECVPNSVAGSAIVTDCNDGWTAYNGSCYQFGHDTMTYLEAEVICLICGPIDRLIDYLIDLLISELIY